MTLPVRISSWPEFLNTQQQPSDTHCFQKAAPTNREVWIYQQEIARAAFVLKYTHTPKALGLFYKYTANYIEHLAKVLTSNKLNHLSLKN